MAATITFKFSLLLSLLLVSFVGGRSDTFQNVPKVLPPKCLVECPSYDVIEGGNGYEIRRYNSFVWISDSPIQGTSFVKATRTGFQRLFDYIHGNNNYKQKINMTAPVITEVSPRGGTSSFVVSFNVPKLNQANPPTAKGLSVQRLQNVYAVVGQFGGYVTDSNIGGHVAALNSSLAGTKWAVAIEKSPRTDYSSLYTVAQYQAPFRHDNRVNEIWFLFHI